jgi:hypothetical protein
MAKMNWQKVSRDSQLKRQPTLNFDKKTSESKLQKLWTHAIKTETKFLSGKYWNRDIGTIVDIDPKYCTWILENKPTGVIAKQIIRHFNR